MSTPSFREPTNEQLWAQPPSGTGPSTPPPVPARVVPVTTAPVSQARPAPVPPTQRPSGRQDRTVFALAIVSLGAGIPLTAISLTAGGRLGLMIVWVGIVLVNLVYAWSRHRK